MHEIAGSKCEYKHKISETYSDKSMRFQIPTEIEAYAPDRNGEQSMSLQK